MDDIVFLRLIFYFSMTLFFFIVLTQDSYELFSSLSLSFTRLSRLSQMLAKFNVVNRVVLIYFFFLFFYGYIKTDKDDFFSKCLLRTEKIEVASHPELASGADLLRSVNFSSVGCFWNNYKMMLNAAFLRPDINFLHVKQYSLQHVHRICAPARSLGFRSHSIAYQDRTFPPLRGSLSFTSFLHGQQRDAFKLSLSADGDSSRARSEVVSRASKAPTLFTYPPMTTKPKWWWRTLACTPYLLPLHLMWLHAVTAYHLHRLLENWDFLVNPFIDTIILMPNWLMMALIFAAYYLVVRRKEWPHFLRFHVIMAMLLENGYQAIAIACTWLPNTFYRGKLGATFWLAVTFMQLYTVVECMRAALSGMYADVPLVSDTAYLHSDLKLF